MRKRKGGNKYIIEKHKSGSICGGFSVGVGTGVGSGVVARRFISVYVIMDAVSFLGHFSVDLSLTNSEPFLLGDSAVPVEVVFRKEFVQFFLVNFVDRYLELVDRGTVDKTITVATELELVVLCGEVGHPRFFRWFVGHLFCCLSLINYNVTSISQINRKSPSLTMNSKTQSQSLSNCQNKIH